MPLNTILLICAALIPAFVLCIYVFKKDRVEKEPVLLLLGLLVLGGIICLPAAETEEVFSALINKIFSPLMYEQDGQVYMESLHLNLYNAVKYFIGVAFVEEGFKWIIMFFATRKNKNFNSLFDGLIYAVFVSLGFAALENVLYVLSYGWSTAIARAVTSVPGHMFFAVTMGYYYSLWHVYEKAHSLENELAFNDVIKKYGKGFSGKRYLLLSFAVPTFVHGLYDYCCTSDSLLSLIVFFLLLIFLYVYCFGRIGKMSKFDVKDSRFAVALLVKKYPQLSDVLHNTAANSVNQLL